MPKRPKLKIDQIPKIRPFFQSARHADPKNAKKFEKSWFFKDFLQRKPIRSHATSQNFCLKKLPWCQCHYTWVSKKNVRFVLKVVIWALKAKKWPCRHLPGEFLKTMSSTFWVLSYATQLGALEDSRKFAITVPCAVCSGIQTSHFLGIRNVFWKK